MIVYVDIDETICANSADRNYTRATPLEDNIVKVNKLHSQGHEIVYWTARGATTGIDWRETTEAQLKKWGALYHRIEIGNKPYFDLLIDDKSRRIEEL